MIKVTKLTYSNKDFKDILRTVPPIKDDTKKMDLDPFPSTADLTIFANDVYLDKDDLTSDDHCSDLPKDWKLLTTVDGSKGYFGCLYFNSSRQQVVLAHRGTVPLIFGTVWADLKSVVLNKYTDYMFSAITLGDDIKRAILDLNKQNGVRFTLTVTGHSLGGWISQVTAITLKHLKRQGDGFIRVSSIDEGIHAHTVVFDSPGVKHMVLKIQQDYLICDYNPCSIFRSLDITTLFIAVNSVNTNGYHVGTMYQINSNQVDRFRFMSIFKHGIKYFTEAFRGGDVQLYYVKGWPLGSRELDLRKSIRLHYFSEAELDLVKLLRMIKQNQIIQNEIQNFFDTKLNFQINRKEKTIILDNEINSKQFLKNIKNSLRWFSRGLQDAMKDQITITVPSVLLDMFSNECLDSIALLPDCEDPFSLCEFTNNTTRVLYVQAADCSLEMARIYNILLSGYPDIDDCIFLNWKKLLKLNKILKTKSKSLPLTNDRLNLFVISIDSTTDITLVEEVLENVFLKFKEHTKKKAVIVSQKNPDLFRLVDNFQQQLAISCWPRSAQKCLEFTLKDLKDTSRRELLSKEFIILGEQAMSLNKLLGENCQSSVSIDDVLKPFLKDLLMGDSFNLNIPNNLLKFDQLDVMFSKINREVNKDSLTKLLLEKTCTLFVSSNVRQLPELQLQEVPRAGKRVRDVSGSSEEDFRQACLEDSSVHIAYWLTVTDGRLYLKQIYNRSFFLSRQFHDQSVVDVKKLVQKRNYVDLFVFVGVTDKATLMRYLKASSEVENLFSTNLKFKLFQNSTKTENVKGIDLRVRHTLEVVKEGEDYLLVWRDSQGSLDSLLPCLSSRLLSEEDLCARKVVIISDLPGMGKSTSLTLTSLSRHLDNSWVFRINLRDRPADIKNLPEQMSVKSVAHFLAGASCESATLSLLQFCLQSQGSRQIHVLLDGFDEMRDEDTVEKILNLCQFLKNETTAKIIVTTRDSHENVLVNQLSTVATKFEVITEKIQLKFLVEFWHSHAVLGQKKEKLQLFAQHLYQAAHKMIGGDTIRLIGIPLHTRMLAEAFLQQAEQFSSNAETIPNIIGMNNVYNLFEKFTSVKRDIFLKEKISFSSYDSNTLCDTLIVNHRVLAFKILDPEFQKKYLPTGATDYNEMNRFGLTQWKRENHCDFIHRTFAEYFSSQLLVLWLRRDNFRYMYLPIEEWFLGKLLINTDFKVVRMFMDEHLAEEPLEKESKQLLYDNMSKCWSKDAEAFRGENGETALHVAVEEGNTNIIDLLLGGLVTKQFREHFESFLLARNYDGNTALKTSLEILCPFNPDDFQSTLPIKKGIKQMLNVSHLSYELIYKLLLYALFKDQLLPRFSDSLYSLLTCAHSEKNWVKLAIKRFKVFQNIFLSGDRQQKRRKLINNFILDEQNHIVERKFLPLARICGDTAINIESRVGNYGLVKQFIQINRDVVNSRDSDKMTPLHCAAKGGHIELVKLLHQQGARLNARDYVGRTALSIAVKSDNTDNQDIVKYLLEHGADFKFSDYTGKTLLHFAIERKKWTMAICLIEAGADRDILDHDGKTPLDYVTDADRLNHLKSIETPSGDPIT